LGGDVRRKWRRQDAMIYSASIRKLEGHHRSGGTWENNETGLTWRIKETVARS
jgi:hypothetical protein